MNSEPQTRGAALAACDMPMNWSYPARFEHLPGEVIVRFDDLPEAVTGAETMEAARALAEDVLEEAILWRLSEGRPIPAPRAAREGEVLVPLDPLTGARACVAMLLAERKMTKVALAAAMGADEKAVRRIVDGSRGVSMRTVTSALKALGMRASLSVAADAA